MRISDWSSDVCSSDLSTNSSLSSGVSATTITAQLALQRSAYSQWPCLFRRRYWPSKSVSVAMVFGMRVSGADGVAWRSTGQRMNASPCHWSKTQVIEQVTEFGGVGAALRQREIIGRSEEHT